MHPNRAFSMSIESCIINRLLSLHQKKTMIQSISHLQVGFHLLFGHKLLLVLDSLHFWTVSFGDEVVLRLEGRVRKQLELLRASEDDILWMLGVLFDVLPDTSLTIS